MVSLQRYILKAEVISEDLSYILETALTLVHLFLTPSQMINRLCETLKYFPFQTPKNLLAHKVTRHYEKTRARTQAPWALISLPVAWSLHL